VQVLLSRHLHQTLDNTLRDRAAQVAQLAATAPGLLTSPAAVSASAETGQLDVEVVDRHGRVVSPPIAFGGARLPAGPLLPAAIRHGRSGYRDGLLAGRRARLYVAPLADVGGPASGGAVIVASTTNEIDSTLAESRTLIIASALVAALLVAPIAYILTGRALRPLATLAAGAEVIERRRDPSLRLSGVSGDGHTSDEVARLADTLNRMLAALERARESERRFVADASHELRNPLAALRGNAEYLARHGSDREALDDLRADAERLSRLVDELLRLAHEDAADVPAEPVRLDELALQAAGDRITIRAGDQGLVRGDEAALDRALRNLIENALQHGPAGGPVAVTVSRRDGEVRLTVSDTGAGIPPELVEAATTRFWRGEDARSKPGSGLGLALVQATAERHGGRLEIDGARITLVLPALTHLSSERDTTPTDEPEGA
jgi:signal transduction histidine kinase